MSKIIKNVMLVAGLSLSATQAFSSVVSLDVFAKENSSSGGVVLNTSLFFNTGDLISGYVNSRDLWSAGSLPRWSNANGLIADLSATGFDDSGQSDGTLIGRAFGSLTQNGFTSAYGSLVGKINDNYFLLGTDFSIAAPDAGNLSLYYWDSNNSDNTGSVKASFTSAVPEPSTLALMLGGLGLVGFMARCRKQA